MLPFLPRPVTFVHHGCSRLVDSPTLLTSFSVHLTLSSVFFSVVGFLAVCGVQVDIPYLLFHCCPEMLGLCVREDSWFHPESGGVATGASDVRLTVDMVILIPQVSVFSPALQEDIFLKSISLWPLDP